MPRSPRSARPPATAGPPDPRRRRDALLVAGWIGSLAALVGIAGSLGGTLDPVNAILVVADTHLRWGWPALVLLLAGVGLGRTLPVALPSSARPAARAAGPALGTGTLLLLIVLLGTGGLLNLWTAWGVAMLGLAGFVVHRPTLRVRTPAGWLWAGLPGLAVLLVASASPPGSLWSSEYGAYDVLSYHLQLPREWITLGHTHPLEHNVYSFLPGAMEQAYAAIGWLSGAGETPNGLLADNAWRLTGAHTLHAGMTVLGAMMTARLTRRLALAAGSVGRTPAVASALGGGLVLCTPWSVVVGSLAYNEMGVVLLGAGALLAACRRGPADGTRMAALARGAFVGALVGMACLVKPTALLFAGLPAGALLLRFTRLRDWAWVSLGGAFAGVIMLLPWLVRNAAMTGNPVFPLATGLLGEGYWTGAQAARFAAAHAFDGTLPERLSLLIFADPDAPAGANAVARYRGISNTQWLLAFPAAGAGLIVLLARARTRAIGVGLTLGLLLQIIAWLAFTHLQSRFLVPCLLLLAPAIGIGAASLRRIEFGRGVALLQSRFLLPCLLLLAPVIGIAVVSTRRVGLVLGVAVLSLQSLALFSLYAEERGGEPNGLLGAPPAVFMGGGYTPEMGAFSPVAFVNHELPADAVVLLVGDATPLYVRNPVVYATVWDTPPVLGLADGSVHADFVLINEAELARQSASGYLNEGLTPDTLSALTADWRPVRAWPEIGVSLYRVPRGTNGRP